MFGHSFGAICAFEFARELRRRGHDLPIHLFASAILAPHALARGLEGLDADSSGLDDSQFVSRAGATIQNHDALDASAELAELALPVLRADSEALTSYRHAEEAPLAIPISVFAGADDPLMPESALESWRELTSDRFEIRCVPGGHWFPDTHRATFLRHLRGMLNRTLRRLRTRSARRGAGPC